tara:strand:- start:819 stop:1295 length:477 start_codon:yes stop_codon:yes gene_type:complete
MSALQQSWAVVKASAAMANPSHRGIGLDSPGGDPTKDPEADRRQADMDLTASLANPHSNDFHDEVRGPLEDAMRSIKPYILKPGMAADDKHAKKTHGKVKKVRDAIEDALIEVHLRGNHTPGPGKDMDVDDDFDEGDEEPLLSLPSHGKNSAPSNSYM